MMPTDERTDTVAAHWPAVFSLSFAMFCLIAIELLPISLLTPIAGDLGVTIAAAGQVVTATAMIAAVASPLVIFGAGRVDRQKIVWGLTAMLIASCLGTAFAANLPVLLAARAALGFSLGGLWGLATSLVLRLVPSSNVPRAMSLFFGGVTLASIAAPAIGAYVGNIWGWRAIFIAMAVVSGMALVLQFFTLPRLPSSKPPGLESFRITITRRSVLLGLLAVFFVLSGQFAGFTFIRPFLEEVSRFDIDWISIALLLFGAGGVIGTALGGVLAARSVALATGGAAMVLSLAVASLLLLGTSHTVALVSVAIWGIAFGAFPVAISTWNARAASDHAESAGALLASSFQVAVAIGAIVGGAAVDGYGLAGAFTYCALAVFVGAVVMLLVGRGVEARHFVS